MSAFDPQWWEEHYRERGPGHQGGPSPYVVAEAGLLAPGTALDAGCGRGADALWLAARGWQVTAVDVAPTCVRQAEESVAGQDPAVAARIEWVVADLTTWQPPHRYDLVVSQYVHPTGSFGDFAARLADAVAPRGTLLIVGHDHGDEHSGAHAPGDAAIVIGSVTGALDPDAWEITTADTRTRHTDHGTTRTALSDSVVAARRLT